MHKLFPTQPNMELAGAASPREPRWFWGRAAQGGADSLGFHRLQRRHSRQIWLLGASPRCAFLCTLQAELFPGLRCVSGRDAEHSPPASCPFEVSQAGPPGRSPPREALAQPGCISWLWPWFGALRRTAGCVPAAIGHGVPVPVLVLWPRQILSKPEDRWSAGRGGPVLGDRGVTPEPARSPSRLSLLVSARQPGNAT